MKIYGNGIENRAMVSSSGCQVMIYWYIYIYIYIYCNVTHVSGKLFNAVISNDVQYGLTLSNVIGNKVVKTTNLSHNFVCHKINNWK